MKVIDYVMVPSPEDVFRLAYRHADASEPRPLGLVRAFAQGRPRLDVVARGDDEIRGNRVRSDFEQHIGR